jgi:hypothetical protein
VEEREGGKPKEQLRAGITSLLSIYLSSGSSYLGRGLPLIGGEVSLFLIATSSIESLKHWLLL